ncbi:MAG: CdaR family protein [Candidatus Scalindua sp.]|nr:CdaR family protein [Candidatus Scalindua sp.]MCR4344481.1 CdaR family protein [Candidatus Scalindua sp.]
MIKRLFSRNLRAKGMALVMAMALWFYATSRHTGDIKEDIQLTINAPPGLTILDTSSDIVTVSLSGPQNIIDNITDMIKDNEIKARLDIPEVNNVEDDNYKKIFRLTGKNFNFPREIRLTSIVPNEIEITLGRLETKFVKVQIQKKGTPAPGYEINSEFFFPREVLVTGPVNILKEADTISTSVVNIDAITSEQNRTFPWVVDIENAITIKKNDKYISVPVKCEEKINVWFHVNEQMGTKTFDNVKVNIFHPVNYHFKVTLKEEFISLSLKGSRLSLDKLNAKDIMAYIDVSSLSPPGPYNQPVICNIPKGLELEGNPPESHVDIVETVVKKE